MANNITPRGFVYGVKPADENREPNFKLDAIFTAMISRPLDLKKLQFKRMVIEEALKAFGTNSFTDWIMNQITSPFMDELHIDFIKDTVNYILTGERKYDSSTWNSIISREIVVPATRVELTDLGIDEFLGISSGGVPREYRINYVKDVLKVWLTSESSLQDLIYTLYILFGSTEKPSPKLGSSM